MVLIDKMCLWIYCCGMAAHIWWITRVSSLRFSCIGCTRTLPFNRSNKWSIGFKSILLQAIWVFARCLLQKLLVSFYISYLMSFIKDNQRGIISYQIRQLPCRARGARAHNLFSPLPFRMDNFVHGNVFRFR